MPVLIAWGAMVLMLGSFLRLLLVGIASMGVVAVLMWVAGSLGLKRALPSRDQRGWSRGVGWPTFLVMSIAAGLGAVLSCRLFAADTHASLSQYLALASAASALALVVGLAGGVMFRIVNWPAFGQLMGLVTGAVLASQLRAVV